MGSRIRAKVEDVYRRAVIVGGWTWPERPPEEPEEQQEDEIGALVLGCYDEHGLRYVGTAEDGFTAQMRRDLAERLTELERATSPFDTDVPEPAEDTVAWAEPELVGEVIFATWTDDNIFREPVWTGLSPDLAAEQVRFKDETPE